MISSHLERVAFINKEWHTICFILDTYAGEYLEGLIESSMIKFNNLFEKLPLEIVSMYESITVFDCIKTICERRVDCAISAAEIQMEIAE